MDEVCAFERNKRFFGTSQQPDQISKMLDFIRDQDSRIEELEEQVGELLLTLETKKDDI